MIIYYSSSILSPISVKVGPISAVVIFIIPTHHRHIYTPTNLLFVFIVNDADCVDLFVKA